MNHAQFIHIHVFVSNPLNYNGVHRYICLLGNVLQAQMHETIDDVVTQLFLHVKTFFQPLLLYINTPPARGGWSLILIRARLPQAAMYAHATQVNPLSQQKQYITYGAR